MDKRRVFAHPDYFTSLRKAKAEKSIADLTPFVAELYRILTTEENPLALAKPVENRLGRWVISIRGLDFEIEPDGEDIKVLSVE